MIFELKGGTNAHTSMYTLLVVLHALARVAVAHHSGQTTVMDSFKTDVAAVGDCPSNPICFFNITLLYDVQGNSCHVSKIKGKRKQYFYFFNQLLI